MLRLACKIVVHEVDKQKPLIINFVNEIKIEESWRSFTDTATVRLPRFIQGELEEFDVLDKKFRSRMLRWLQTHPDIEIYLGYETPRDLAFKGVIREIQGRVPVVLVCEDHMFFLKSKLLSQSYPIKVGKSLEYVSVFEFVSRHVAVFFEQRKIALRSSAIVDLSLGSLVLKNHTVLDFFELLKEEYGIYSFMRYVQTSVTTEGERTYIPVLCIGTEYEKLPVVSPVLSEADWKSRPSFSNINFAALTSEEPLGFFRFHDNIIEDDLVYIDYHNVKVRVKYVLQGKAESDKLSIVIPRPKPGDDEDDFEEYTYKFYDPSFKLTKQTLGGKTAKKIYVGDRMEMLDPVIRKVMKLAVKKFKQLKYSGFRGSFTTFGETIYTTSEGEKVGDFIRPGDIIELRDQSKQGTIADFHLENQKYFVDAVEHSFGVNGYREVIFLGANADPDPRIRMEQSVLETIEVAILAEEGGSLLTANVKLEGVVMQSITKG